MGNRPCLAGRPRRDADSQNGLEPSCGVSACADIEGRSVRHDEATNVNLPTMNGARMNGWSHGLCDVVRSPSTHRRSGCLFAGCYYPSLHGHEMPLSRISLGAEKRLSEIFTIFLASDDDVNRPYACAV